MQIEDISELKQEEIDYPKDIDLGVQQSKNKRKERYENVKHHYHEIRATQPIKLTWEDIEFEVEVPVKNNELRENGVKTMK